MTNANGAAATRTRSTQDRGLTQRLKDQLKVQKKIEAIRANPRVLNEIAFYPAHDKRRETPEYKAVHKDLVVTKDLPCLVCGVRNSTLKDKTKNPYGARQLETHHHIVEWALANAISADKFNDILLPHLKVRHAGKPDYAKDAFTDEDIRNWVDHSPDNLWVLCDVHHRAKYLGIHEITYPIWSPSNLLRTDFEDYVKGQLAAEDAKGGKAKKPATKGNGR